jgi:diacylglycerol kinase family enzyme
MGVGFSAEVVRRLLEFKHLRGFPLYLAAVYRTFVRFHAPELEVCTEEHRERGRIMMIEVTNGPTAGGGFRLTPDAVPDDGVFDVCCPRLPSSGLSGFDSREATGLSRSISTVSCVAMCRAQSPSS